MEDNQNRLWQGGAWERPQEGAAVTLPACTAYREEKDDWQEVYPRRRRRGWLGFAVFLLLIISFTASAAMLSHYGLPEVVQGLLPGWSEGAGSSNAPFAGTDYDPQSQPTTIPRAPAGGTARLPLDPVEGEVLSLQEIYEGTIPSIVYIRAIHGNIGYAAGTGVVMTADGYILTNEHVISGASVCEVVFYDNTTLEAELVGVHSGCDLAVLKVQADDLTPARFGNSAELKVGDEVVAIGNPLSSSLRGTMTEGIISAINRSVSVGNAAMPMIQTSAALNMGNSGGALINNRGQVVGITTMKIRSNYGTGEGLGFAIPTRFAKSIVDQIIATGVAKNTALGIKVYSDIETYGGLLVSEVSQNSDSWAKGLRPGDVIVAVNGIPITDNNTLSVEKEPLSVGDTLSLTIERKGERMELAIILMDADLFS